MAQAGPPPVSADGLWFWDGSGWKSLLSADGRRFWNGSTWIDRPPSVSPSQPPAGPPPGRAAGPPRPPVSGALPSPPGYPPSAPAPATQSPPPSEPVEPRPSWLPADAPWPPTTFSASPPPIPPTTAVAMPGPAPGPVPWANVYSEVMASSTTRGRAYAGFWIRFIAYFIDSLIVGIPVIVIDVAVVVGTGAGASQDPALANRYTSVINLLSTALDFAYFVYFWSLGSTPGMRIFGIRVADQSTFANIGLGKAVLRYIGFLVASFCCAIGLIWAAFDGRKQGWHDKIGGTVVVYR